MYSKCVIIASIGECAVADNSNNIVVFNSTVNDMMQCKLIMVDKHIASLLQCVAVTPCFKQCIADTLRTASYASEFGRARVTLTRPDGVTQSQLKLPLDKQRLFTFIVCLLLEVDSGKRDFIALLEEFFPDNDSNVSYRQFVDNVMRPFKKAGVAILKSANADRGIDASTQMQAENCFVGENVYIAGDVMDQLAGHIDALVHHLNGGIVLHKSTNQECQYMCMCMLNALLTNNPKLIKVVWIGFRATLSELDNSQQTLLDMYNIMKANQII